MRPHVELIHEDDYIWHGAELIGGEGRASERRLSVDEEDGSASLRIDFHTRWGRGPGIHHANAEYYVLEGGLTYGDRTIGPGAYVFAPKGVPVEAMSFFEGTKILHYREYGDAGFDPVDSTAAPRWPDAREDVIVLDTEAMPWQPVPNEGPMPGMVIKYLHVDPVSGFYTRLVHAEEGWTDHRLAHHPCFEEAYTTQGHMEYNFGTLDLGTYFFRPARVKHGHFTTMEGGATWLLRSDGQLFNWYTQNEWVRWGGDAVNWASGGTPTRWSISSHDLGDPNSRSAADLADLAKATDYFRQQDGIDLGDYLQHGSGTDPSLIAIAKAVDLATLSGSHTHAHAMDFGPDPHTLEHPHERTDAHSHNWGAGRPWHPGDPIPAPILSSLPVRSRSRGRWDGDGM
ncbi:DUF4437 domain-containing protein [Nocardia transvalensis]|uniref:DUF4437 domain-containing protein n=1 Tax=Nocardia transvalensis TaxID=37333 RepID=UPI0018931532|nr:DUF4437 domain-containing protein [Nocardia transvalensis]MBF6331163.1 DUF4437 domain-containing protein [Nocardia transvalensis]